MTLEELDKLAENSPAGDLQWISGGVDRVLQDEERNVALPLLREKIDYWAETWPKLIEDYRRTFTALTDLLDGEKWWDLMGEGFTEQRAKDIFAIAGKPIGEVPNG